MHQLSYSIDASFPASDLIRQISETLASLGYQRQAEDYLNPGTQIGGWHSFTDATGSSEVAVCQWICEWVSENGTFVHYCLLYRGSDLTKLRVMASRVPTALLDSELETLREQGW